MDHIFIDDLEVFANHGVMKEEQALGQKFLVSIDMELSFSMAARTDDLNKTVNYAAVSEYAESFLKENTFLLIETAARKLSQAILIRYDVLEAVSVTIKKPWAPIHMSLDTAGVSVRCERHKAIIAYGSNMGEREAYIEKGLEDLLVPGVSLIRRSETIKTKPVGPVAQRDFLNGCVYVSTVFSPIELLDICHAAENNAGRKREIHWGPRTLDLDIIAYDDLVMDTEELKLPHPEMANRRFVLEPLREVCPDYIHPVLKKSVDRLLNELPDDSVRESGIIKDSPIEAELLNELPKENIKVVFQGEAGAYTQAAMLKYFGEEVTSCHVPEWSQAVDEVEEGRADFAVLPMENSNAGAITAVADLLIERNIYIVAEEYLSVNHCLLGIKGSSLSDIKTIYSHPQALMQCSHFLEAHKDIRQISMKNTAFSAMKVKEDGDRTQAAIASEISAKINGLDILERGINNKKNNITRFIIISKRPIITPRAKKISICVELDHEPGALYKLLSYISIFNLNMEMIESRPIPGKNFEYRFFIDFAGNISQPDVVSALRGIKQGANKIWFLGNY